MLCCHLILLICSIFDSNLRVKVHFLFTRNIVLLERKSPGFEHLQNILFYLPVFCKHTQYTDLSISLWFDLGCMIGSQTRDPRHHFDFLATQVNSAYENEYLGVVVVGDSNTLLTILYSLLPYSSQRQPTLPLLKLCQQYRKESTTSVLIMKGEKKFFVCVHVHTRARTIKGTLI